jgi:hypothetical protein
MRLHAIALVLAAQAAAATNISDPEAFVTQVYRAIAAKPRDYAPPSDIYTPRLAALFAADRKKAGDEVGCIDFDFWSNSQDPTGLRNIHVTSQPASAPDRRTVVATFGHFTRPAEIHFEFRRVGGRWLLDDASSVKEERWVLSQLLQCTP